MDGLNSQINARADSWINNKRSQRTLSEIRREIRSLRRKYHREIAIYRMRRVTEQVHYDYARAVADRQDPPRPQEIVRRIADQGFRLTTWMNLLKYLERVREAGDIPEPRTMLTNLLTLGVGHQVRPPADAELPAVKTGTRPVPALGPLVRHGIRDRDLCSTIVMRSPCRAEVTVQTW